MTATAQSAAPRGFDPYRTQAQEREAREQKAARESVALTNADNDLVRLLAEPWGRRIVRRRLGDALLEFRVPELFYGSHGQMCFEVGKVEPRITLFLRVAQLLLTEQVPLETGKKLFSERD